MSESIAQPAKGSSSAGLVLGIVSAVVGGLSILLLAILLAPLGLLSGLIGALVSFRRKYTLGGVLGLVGMILSGIGLATSPTFWLMFGGALWLSSAPSPKPAQKAVWQKEEPKKVTAPKVVEGEGKVIDSATILVSGVKVSLNGLVPTTREQAEILQDFLSLQGGKVRCEPEGSAGYTCRTGEGVDVGEAALLNGAAKASATAPAKYLERQAQAKERKAGIWTN